MKRRAAGDEAYAKRHPGSRHDPSKYGSEKNKYGETVSEGVPAPAEARPRPNKLPSRPPPPKPTPKKPYRSKHLGNL